MLGGRHLVPGWLGRRLCSVGGNVYIWALCPGHSCSPGSLDYATDTRLLNHTNISHSISQAPLVSHHYKKPFCASSSLSRPASYHNLDNMLSFLTTLLLAGSSLAAPTAREEAETCTERSQKVTLWNVEKFDFHSSYVFTTPAHQNSWGYVNFTLSNPAIDYKPVCSAESSQLSDFFYGTQEYTCTVGDDAPGGGGATFTYSRPSGELRINQTWTCFEEQSVFEAKGGAELDLNCRDETWENPDWQQGEMYSVRTVACNKVDVQAPIEEISAIRRKA